MPDAVFRTDRANATRLMWTRVCNFFVWISVLTGLMLIAAEIVVMAYTIRHYDNVMGEGQAPAKGYERDGSSPLCGYVYQTTVAKHLGGIYFTMFYEVCIVIWLILIISADGMFLYKTDQNRLNGALTTFWLTGLQDGPDQHKSGADRIPPFYIIALGFLKLYVVVLYESQSFVEVPSGRDGGGSGPNGNRFCLLAGFIYLGNILPSIVAALFYGAYKKDWYTT